MVGGAVVPTPRASDRGAVEVWLCRPASVVGTVPDPFSVSVGVEGEPCANPYLTDRHDMHERDRQG